VDTCPVCLLYDRTAVAAALLQDLAPVAMQAGGLPVGLGGTVALASRRVDEALAQVAPVSRMAPGLGVAQLGNHLQRLHGMLVGWLQPGQIASAASFALECRRQAHVIAWSYFAGR
jgi:hypothetical protein